MSRNYVGKSVNPTATLYCYGFDNNSGKMLKKVVTVEKTLKMYRAIQKFGTIPFLCVGQISQSELPKYDAKENGYTYLVTDEELPDDEVKQRWIKIIESRIQTKEYVISMEKARIANIQEAKVYDESE